MTIGAKQGRSWGGEGEENATVFGESQTEEEGHSSTGAVV